MINNVVRFAGPVYCWIKLVLNHHKKRFIHDVGHSPNWVKWLKLTKFCVVYVVLYVVKATGVGAALCVCWNRFYYVTAIRLITWSAVSQTICTDLRHIKG
ncbi:unnamed protein product [Musa textilis]